MRCFLRIVMQTGGRLMYKMLTVDRRKYCQPSSAVDGPLFTLSVHLRRDLYH